MLERELKYRMQGPSEIAREIINSFDSTSTRKLSDVITQFYVRDGVNQFEAAERAERIAPQIKEILEQEYAAEERPFRFGDSDPFRLVGKARARLSDPPETGKVKRASTFVPKVVGAIDKLDDEQFEVLSALCVKLSGATEAYALCAGDEGGIDIFGRVHLGSPLQVEPGLIYSNLLQGRKGLLFLGQCKRQQDPVGPSKIREMLGAVQQCVKKYKGNTSLPSHRVDPNFYDEGETCIPIFVTSSVFTDRAEGSGESGNFVMINGSKLAQFICSRTIGFSSTPEFDFNIFVNWIQSHRSEVTYDKNT